MISRTREYGIWAGMKSRCNNPNSTEYFRYGGCGVMVCDRWGKFENFIEDMGLAPSEHHTIDRYPNKSGDYEPANCRRATPKEQNRNTNRTRIIEFNGKIQCMQDWAKELGIAPSSLYERIVKLGWTIDDALTKPKRKGDFSKKQIK